MKWESTSDDNFYIYTNKWITKRKWESTSEIRIVVFFGFPNLDMMDRKGDDQTSSRTTRSARPWCGWKDFVPFSIHHTLKLNFRSVFLTDTISARVFSKLVIDIDKRFFASCSWLSLVSWKNNDFSRKWSIIRKDFLIHMKVHLSSGTPTLLSMLLKIFSATYPGMLLK